MPQSPPEPRHRFARALAYGNVAGGVTCVAIWGAGHGAALALDPEWIPIAPLTALLAVLHGIALLATTHAAAAPRARSAARALSVVVVLVAVLALLRAVTGTNPITGHVFTASSIAINGIAFDRVSPLTGLLFSLLGVGLLARLDTQASRQRLATLSVIAGGIALVFLQGYALGAPLFYDKAWVPIAALTSFFATLLALGNIAVAGTDVWPLRVFSPQATPTARASRQAVALVAATVGLIIAVSGAHWFRAERRETVKTASQELERLAAAKASEIAEWRRGHLRAAQLLLHAQPLLPIRAAGAGATRQWLQDRIDRDGYVAAALFAADGRTIESLPGPELFAPGLPGIPLDVPVDAQDLRLRRVYRSGNDRFADVWIPLTPTTAGAAQGAGWLMLRVDVAHELGRLLGNISRPHRTSELLLLQVDGTTLEPLVDAHNRLGAANTGTVALQALNLGVLDSLTPSRSVLTTARDPRGIEVLAAATPVYDTEWYVVASVDRAEILEASTRLAVRLAIITVLLILGTAGVTNALAARRDLAAADRELLLVRQREDSIDELRRSEDRYARAIRGTADGLWDWNLATNDLYVSPRFVELLGGDPLRPHTVDSEFFDRLHPDDAARMRERLAAHLERDEEYDLEFRLRRDTGDYRWFWVRGEVERAADGTPVRMAGAITDVTARRLAEDTLRDTDRILQMRTAASLALAHASSEAELLQAVCSVAVREGGYRMAWVGYAEFDDARSVSVQAVAGDDRGYVGASHITWDDSVTGMGPTGRCIRLGIPQVAQDLMHDPRFEPWREAAAERGFAASCSIPLRVAGSVIGALMLYSERPFAFHEEEVKLLNEIANDLSFGIGAQRDHLAVAKEQERAAFFRSVLDESDSAIFIVDLATGRFLDFNYTAHEQLGYSAEELHALDVTALVPRFQSVTEWRNAEARLGEEGVNPTVRSAHRRKDGSEFPVDVTRTRLTLEGRDIILVTARDVSNLVEQEGERAALQEQLFRSQRMESVGRLAGGIAHDFNNLLTVINNTADLAIRELPRDAPLRSDLLGIRAAGQRAATLTRQLLAFSRQQVLRRETLDLHKVLREFVTLVRRVIGEDIALRVSLADQPATVFADPSQLEQVMMNLCVNARDAMPGGGVLAIETECLDIDAAFAESHQGMKPGPHVRLSITDTGVGMTPEVQQRMFDPFFTTKEAGKGTGLGLATVYGIIKQSDGSIWVESTVGKGTRFDVYLPLVAATADLVERPSGPSAVLQGGHETVLIVEDEPAIRMVAHRILARSGYTVFEAASGDEALRLITERDGPLDLVITDLVMPGISGVELARTLRERYPTLPVLLSSGYSAEALSTEIGGEDGWHFINKPYAVDELLRMVRLVLDEASGDAGG